MIPQSPSRRARVVAQRVKLQWTIDRRTDDRRQLFLQGGRTHQQDEVFVVGLQPYRKTLPGRQCQAAARTERVFGSLDYSLTLPA